jgi:hypothetical protein
LFKIKDGECVGGYTVETRDWQWVSPDVKEYTSRLFNLSLQYNYNHSGKSFEMSGEKGPCFYDGSLHELSAVVEPFNGEGNCISETDES